MKAHLLHRDKDLDLQRPLPWNQAALIQDLSLDTLFSGMARDDTFVFEMAKRVVLLALDNDVETIRYRQQILEDCLNHPAVVREFYSVAGEIAEREKRLFLLSRFDRYPELMLRQSVDLLEMFLDVIKKLKRIADAHASKFTSEGWTALFAVLQTELSDEYFARVQHHLQELKFRHGVLLSAQLGKGNQGTSYTLHSVRGMQQPRGWKRLRVFLTAWFATVFGGNWLRRRSGPTPPLTFGFSLDPRDESGAKALAELRGLGISPAASALAQSADHVRSFFKMLRTEMAFYIGCVNLYEQLAKKGEPTCFPSPALEEHRLSFRGLYDVPLWLSTAQDVIGNDANADEQNLVLVTGANQGGKSTFLRSIGVAQLMMQCGMFAPADEFSASIYDGIFTHYKREEDVSMKSGKLDEELTRMSDIVDHLKPHSMLLLNESFAATNEREGSEIARQIVSALVEKRVKVVCVTHLFEFARGFHRRNNGGVLFLRAERLPDGGRTFKLVEGEPLQTSFGEDLYDAIFGNGVRGLADRTSL